MEGEYRGLPGRSGNIDEPDDFEPPPAVRTSRPRDLAGSLLGLLLLIGFHASQTKHWIANDNRPQGWDQSVQLETAWDLKQCLAQGDLGCAMRMPPKPGMPPFPLLFHLTGQPALGAADPVAGFLWLNWAYLAFFCFAAWGLGRHFLGDWQGLGAAVLITCVPNVQWLQREVLVDIALCAWVAAGYWALAASDGFRKKGQSLLFGVLFAAAMMTKWSAFSYFLPVLFIAFNAFTSSHIAGLLLAGGSAAVLAGPWYLAQAPILAPRLFEAAADQAVPIWQGGAVFSYVLQMADGLELPLFLLGVLAAFVPTLRRRTEDAWILPAWFVSSLIFWTIVPNRQLRYLLPGITPLAVLAMGPWPKGVSAAACALSLAMAWNYPRGAVGRVGFNPGLPLFIFKSDLPAREDWRHGEILRAAQDLRDTSLPFSNIAFVANHPRLNGPVLNWERKRLGIEGLRIRGITKRYTELCEFVLVKTGDLGPASVTGQLPEVQRVMLDPGRWFQVGWREARRWPLPDKTEAVLFQRRRLTKAPAGEGKLRVDYFEEGNFKAEGLELDFGRWDAERGVYPKVEVRAASLMIRGLEVTGVNLTLERLALLNADETDAAKKDPLSDPRFTRLDAVTLRKASVSQEALAFFLGARVKGLEGATASLEGGVAAAQGKLKGKPVRAAVELKLLPDGAGLEVQVRGAALMGVPLPVRLFSASRIVLPFTPTSELPFRISVPSLSVSGGRLTIGG
ncbi:MAG: hypothetical protein HYZ75_10805 [Elusimicrobia bacterium]|nr:hypothetical protein [Elusimicrobiota bacterium]